MKLYSTKNNSHLVELKEAVLKGLPPDNGLYMPVNIPRLPDSFFSDIEKYSFQDIAYQVCHALFDGYIPDEKTSEIVRHAVNFPAPLVKLNEDIQVLELFHGPSLAFKDFGARFMAQLMSYFNEKEDQELIILVATSGDTGGAVAAGFYDTPGIQVVILYPSGKVSTLQEKQLTTLGKNITALEVDGTFDDCQALVKKAFLDKDLNQQLRLSSANSINISRLIPQSFYYFEAYKQAPRDREIAFCIPSGNFGNLTAGLIAREMGLPVSAFLAATNANDVVPEYLQKGQFNPRPSVRTLSNAMDVGNPSNFARMQDIFKGQDALNTWERMKKKVWGFAFDDKSTQSAILDIKNQYDYVIDPHGAVGYLAIKEFQKQHANFFHILLETAHPAKFMDDMERILQFKIELPKQLSKLIDKPKTATQMKVDYEQFRQWLRNNY